MKIFKILEIKDDGVHARISCENTKWVYDFPHSYIGLIKPGDKIHIHEDSNGVPVAYGSNGKMFLSKQIESTSDAELCLKDFSGIKNLSLDRLLFSIAVRKALEKRDVKPTLSALANLVMLHR
jgi:hypothetical protein